MLEAFKVHVTSS